MINFCIILFAMIGNARLFGMDVVLTFIAPICLTLIFLAKPKLTPSALLIGVFISILATLLTFRTLQFEVLLGYDLWLLKAVLLIFFISQNSFRIASAEVHLFFGLCFVLFLTTTDTYGRSYGLFGPNMLYRFYGLLYLLSIFMLATKQAGKPFWLTYVGFATIGIFLTGSVGGLVLMLAGLLLVFRFTVVSVSWLTGIAILLFALWPRLQDTSMMQRVILKASWTAVQDSSRFSNGLGIVEKGIKPFGWNYSDFNSLWLEGFEYPHNIFIELTAFLGLPGVVISLIIMAAVIIVWRRAVRRESTAYDLCFIAILTGSLFSGELSDNYGAVGFAVSFFLVSIMKRVGPSDAPQPVNRSSGRTQQSVA